MSDSRPAMPELRVGDQLTQRLNGRRHYKPEDVTVQVIRVGRQYAYARKLDDLSRGVNSYLDIKFDKTTGFIHGGGYSSPGRVSTEEQLVWDDRAKAAEGYLKSKGFNEWDLRNTPYARNFVHFANMIADDLGDEGV